MGQIEREVARTNKKHTFELVICHWLLMSEYLILLEYIFKNLCLHRKYYFMRGMNILHLYTKENVKTNINTRHVRGYG